jgi:hypothetical protein
MRVLSLGADRLALAQRGAWKKLTAEERFWARVEEEASGCWRWTGAKTGRGYGVIAPSGKRLDMAHRFAYKLLVGPIAPGLTIDHLCRNQLCVNPAHLEPVTQAENTARGTSPTAIAARSGFCRNGHSKTVENWEPGHSRCRICNREAVRAAYKTPACCPSGHSYKKFGRLSASGKLRCRVCFPPRR